MFRRPPRSPLFPSTTLFRSLALEDEIRPESRQAIERLHAMGIRVAMITGDSQAVADSVARRLGIDEVAAQVLPADKADARSEEHTAELQSRQYLVCRLLLEK